MKQREFHSRIISELQRIGASIPEILSIYLYGSSLRDDYNQITSDIDVLFILTDCSGRDIFRRICGEISCLEEPLDLNIILESEFKLRIHPGWSRHFYHNVRHSGIHVFGAELLQSFDDREISFAEAFRRLVQLTQRVRFVETNSSKEREKYFWLVKYQHWIPICLMEFLYLYGKPEYILRQAHQKFLETFPDGHWDIQYPYPALDQIHDFLEKLVPWLLRNRHLF